VAADKLKKKKITDEFEEENVFQAPEIVREPSSRQVKLGSNVVLRITATGKPVPSFQWFHNGKKIAGAVTDRLNLNKVRRSAAGAYHCEAKNHVGTAVSRESMLGFFTQSVPKLVLNVSELHVEEGKPITLKLVPPQPGAFKDFRVFWIFNGMRIKGAHGPELNIPASKKKYEGEYKAMISVGSGIETSNVCKVFVVPEEAQEEGTMVGMLAPPETELAAPPSKADWADSLFNPDEEIEEEAIPENEDSIQKTAPVKKVAEPLKKLDDHLVKKKKFLESFLDHWQKNMAGNGKQAA